MAPSRSIGQHRLDRLLVQRVRPPPGLSLGGLVDQREAREMAAELRLRAARRAAGLRHEGRQRGEAAGLRHGERRRHATPLQGLGALRADASRLLGHAGRGQAFQHEDAHAAQLQLDGGQQAHRPRAHHHDVGLPIHRLNLLIY